MTPTSSTKSGWRDLSSWIVTVCIPLILFVGSARLLMLPPVLTLEYTRAGFGADSYGLTTEDRLLYGPLGVQYIVNVEPIAFLANLTLPADRCFPPAANPCAMFRPSELRHMEDVQRVTQGLFWLALIAFAVTATITAGLAYAGDRRTITLSVQRGCLLTVILVMTIGLIVVFAWDVFFDTFHALFFASGTWTFYYSDSLIRLYSEQLWTDGSIAVGVLSVLLALLLGFTAYRLPRNTVPR